MGRSTVWRISLALFLLVAPAACTASGEEDALVLEEAGSPSESRSSHWWLNSGGRARIAGGEIATLHGALPEGDPWRERYLRSSPVDTEEGRHPQNLFRLVTRSTATNLTEAVRFRIDAVQDTPSPNRNESNGVLLFARYVRSSDLYYAGLRVDGTAVIKRKRNGRYETLARRALYPGRYDPARNPNLLPTGRWIGLRVTVVNEPGGTVGITLSVDDRAGWDVVLEVHDRASKAIRSAGAAGIRSDFLDLTFRDYELVPSSAG